MPPAIDPSRLVRALHLAVEPLGAGRFRVTGGRPSHVVLARPRLRWECDCLDSTMRPATRCKHVIGVYLACQLARPIQTALRDALCVRVLGQGRAQTNIAAPKVIRGRPETRDAAEG